MTKNHTIAGVCTLALAVILAGIASTPLMADNVKKSDWPMFGQDATNNANNAVETSISTANANQLRTKWTFTTGGDVSARAAVVGGVVYFPDWGGNLWAVNALNGKKIWGHQLSDYTGIPGTNSRTTPAVVDGNVYVGTQQGAYLLSIKAADGTLNWKIALEAADPYAIVTTSPVVYNNVVYTGVASLAEGASLSGINLSAAPARGSVVAVTTGGALKWQTYTIPHGYQGGGVWGSNPVVDAARGSLFVGTGNNYSHPTDPAFQACVAAGHQEKDCLSPDDHVDSILALDLNTGAIKWATRLVTWMQYGVTDGSDDWNVDCFFGGPQCPNANEGPVGPDYDFGSSPNEITYQTAHGTKTIIGAGQKSGIYYALDPDSGAELWHTQIGPGSSLGGMEWGSASDGKRIYVAIANLYGIPYAYGNAGSWAALDPATGQILWQRADPNGAIDIGPLSVANGVVYASSMAGSATAPTMLALDGATGKTLWSFASGASVNDGATIASGIVYWGSGYAHLGIAGFTGNNKFFAFSKNGQ